MRRVTQLNPLLPDDVVSSPKRWQFSFGPFRNDTVRRYVGFHAHPRRLVEVVLASVDNTPLVYVRLGPLPPAMYAVGPSQLIEYRLLW